jgi:hypothetical protein
VTAKTVADDIATRSDADLVASLAVFRASGCSQTKPDNRGWLVAA